MTEERSVVHFLNLDTVGGVEHLFFHFIRSLSQSVAERHHLIVTGGPIHKQFAALAENMGSISYAKTFGGFKIPKHPKFLRELQRRRLVRKIAPGAGVIWNRFGDSSAVRALRTAGARVIYYEHGAAWLAKDEHSGFMQTVDHTICASGAAKRVLELKWGWRGSTEIILNPLRPGAFSKTATAKLWPRNRPLRLGVAGRLVPIKGIGVALNTLSELLKSEFDAELHIAGRGRLHPFLEQRCAALNITKEVHFRGVLAEMAGFYDEMDLLIVPSVREPFGMVVIEAAAQGCPAIAARVDGIPEAVNGETGATLKPELPIERCHDFGGAISDFPSQVFDPDTNQLMVPRFLNPVRVAEKIRSLAAEPAIFEEWSAKGIQFARNCFKHEDYVQRLLTALAD